MRLDKDQIQSIRDRKLTYVKNFTVFDPKFDLNYLGEFIHRYGNVSTMWRQQPEDPYQPQPSYQLNENFTVRKLEDRSHFHPYLLFLDNLFRQPNAYQPTNCYMHVSFSSLSGPPHYDTEDVFIIGMHGTTIIQTLPEKENFFIEEGDLIFLPIYKEHKGIPLTPRIVMSVGMYNP
tara:strand:+ start:352 stop:879 length:528 start_codon:yes stop_codon:yes gene_type:complete